MHDRVVICSPGNRVLAEVYRALQSDEDNLLPIREYYDCPSDKIYDVSKEYADEHFPES